MKLIRHILSHSILIGFVTLLVLGFYYRAILFPAVWNEQISQQVDRLAGPYAGKLHAFAAPQLAEPAEALAQATQATPVKVEEAASADVAANSETENVATESAAPVSEGQTDVVASTESTAAVSQEQADVTVNSEGAAVVSEEQTDVAVNTEVNSQSEADVPQDAVVEQSPVVAEQPKVETANEISSQPVEAAKQTAVKETTTQPNEPELVASTDAAAIEETEQQVVNTPVESMAAEVKDVAEVKQQDTKTTAPSQTASPAVEPKQAAPFAKAQAEAPASDQEVVAKSVTSDPDEDVSASSSDKDTVGPNQLWLKARAAYGRGDMNAALQHYLALSKEEDDNPDVFGELGNVHYARGDFKAAGQAYYEAAVRLIELGQLGQIHYLVRVIEGLSPENAAKLKQRLTRN